VTATVPEAATILLPSGDSPGAGRRAAELIGEKLAKSAAVVVGPGLGEDEAADALLAALFGGGQARPAIGFGPTASSSNGGSAGEAAAGSLLAGSEKPLLIDADGLNWLAKQPGWPKLLPPGRAVLTPHVGEMARLLGATADEVTADPLATVRAAAGEWGQVVVLKYGYTAASDGHQTVVAPEAPRSLATAGSGDVFAGVIGAFLAQGVEPLAAAGLAIYVGTRAARRVERRTGTLGLVASDLPPAIAEELARLEGTASDG
jgi:ADP-dependent NAD(P)H-hydrate dehydratase / NAD(P)H-hydrate epimerase